MASYRESSFFFWSFKNESPSMVKSAMDVLILYFFASSRDVSVNLFSSHFGILFLSCQISVSFSGGKSQTSSDFTLARSFKGNSLLLAISTRLRQLAKVFSCPFKYFKAIVSDSSRSSKELIFANSRVWSRLGAFIPPSWEQLTKASKITII